jgi:ATP-binding cassette subfamily B (MDR/TAP) protein 1
VDEEATPTISGQTAVEEAKKKSSSIPIARLFKMSRPEAGFLAIGGIAAALNGAIMPVFAIVYSEILSVFGETDFDVLRERANLFALYFVDLAISSFFINFAQISTFGLSGERMTKRMCLDL